MPLRFIGKVFLPFILLASSYSHASINNNKITCPPVTVIQQSANKIDNAVKFDESYIALSSVPVFNENAMQWRIEVALNAKSRKQAITLGKKAVEGISFCQQIYATDPGNGQYYCAYGPDKSAAVYATVVTK